MFLYAFDAIYVHDRSWTKKESRYSRRPVARLSRKTSDRGRSDIEAQVNLLVGSIVTSNREAPGRDQN